MLGVSRASTPLPSVYAIDFVAYQINRDGIGVWHLRELGRNH